MFDVIVSDDDGVVDVVAGGNYILYVCFNSGFSLMVQLRFL